MFDFTNPIELHKDLNPKLWVKGHLRPEVRKTLLDLARVYYSFLETDATLVDVVVTGSQANYNFTEHSDLDLHLIIPFDEVTCDLDVTEYFETKRKLWKVQHDITVYDIPVEIYTEDLTNPAVSSVYSVIDNKWRKKPRPPIIDYDVVAVKAEAERWAKIIDGAIKSKNVEMLSHVRDMISRYRKEGLAKDGEFGVANLTFKSLRNDGKIAHLMAAFRNAEDDELSL